MLLALLLLEIITIADAILVMENGQIIESGSHNLLLKTGGKYFDLWNKQSLQN